MRIIVTGGRRYYHGHRVEAVLAEYDTDPKPTLVHGGAEGADALAARIATRWGWRVERYPANWDRHGKSAGPRRNQLMVDAGADLLLAFPGSQGTADCIGRAERAGMPVRRVAPEVDR